MTRIEIANNSRYYHVTLNGSMVEKLLMDWDFWGVKKIKLETMHSIRKVKKIKINLTDNEQPYFKDIIKSNGKEIIRSSLSYHISTQGTLTINLYINPEHASKASAEGIGELVSFRMIAVLYSISHSSLTDQQKFNDVANIYNKFQRENLPFSVKKIH